MRRHQYLKQANISQVGEEFPAPSAPRWKASVLAALFMQILFLLMGLIHYYSLDLGEDSRRIFCECLFYFLVLSLKEFNILSIGVAPAKVVNNLPFRSYNARKGI